MIEYLVMASLVLASHFDALSVEQDRTAEKLSFADDSPNVATSQAAWKQLLLSTFIADETRLPVDKAAMKCRRRLVTIDHPTTGRATRKTLLFAG